MKPSIESCYKLLDVSSDCTSAELKKAHKELAQVWHPDRFGTNEALQEKALKKIQEINSAYDQIREYRSLKSKAGVKKGHQKSDKSEPYTMEGRDSAQLTAPLIPVKYRILMLLGFGGCLVILLILLSQQQFESGERQGELSAIKTKQKSVEIRDETFVMRQRLKSRLQNKLDPFLSGLIGETNYTSDIRLEVDAESKMILQIKLLIRLNKDAFPDSIRSSENTKSSDSVCQAASLNELRSTIRRIARLVPSRGDQLDVSCVSF